MVGIYVSDVKAVIRGTKSNRRARSWSRGSCDITRQMQQSGESTRACSMHISLFDESPDLPILARWRLFFRV
jgi:hypothetical protein